MAIQPVTFGGLAALAADELIGIDNAIDATDCVLDDGTVQGRSGYRNALGSEVPVGASGAAQGLWRHHASPTQYRTVVAAGGNVHVVTDPADETAVGNADNGTAKFGASDRICGAQLGRHLYLVSDGVDPADGEPYPMVRVNADGSFTSIESIPQGNKPTHHATSSMTAVRFQDKTRTLGGNARSTTRVNGSSYAYYYDRNNYSGMKSGDSVTVTIAPTSEDWTGYSHIILLACPGYVSKMGSVPIEVSLGDASGTTVWATLGELYDTGVSTTGLAPDIWVFDLGAIPNNVLSAVRYMKFAALSPDDDQVLLITGYVLVAQSPGAGTFQYRTTFYDSGSGQESRPTETLDVTLSEPEQKAFPLVVCAQLNSSNGAVFKSAYVDPTRLPADRIGNYATNTPVPPRSAYCGAPTIRQSIPAAIQSAGACRLWRLCENGWRLVKEPTPWTSATTVVDTIDNRGALVLSNQKWEATGAYSRGTTMAARDGRLVLGYENRVYISGFVAPAQTSDPYPQFPPTPDDDSDGWAFDVAPANKEQILAIVNGDQLYVGTTEAVYAMDDLKPSSAIQPVMRRGVISRMGMAFVEDMCIWASRDGVYVVQGRVNAGWDTRTPSELTQPVRRIYSDWLVPTSATVLAYKERKLYVIVGTRFLRYDFVRRLWVRGTFSHTIVDADHWLDPTTQHEQCWLLTSDRKLERLQNGLATDDATAIGSWTYRTGYIRSDTKMRLSRIIADPTGDVTITAYKGSASGSDTRTVNMSARDDGVEVEQPIASDLGAYKWGFALTADNSVQVRSMFVALEGIHGAGG